jgi:DNA-binding PadR family transcriptional regulator
LRKLRENEEWRRLALVRDSAHTRLECRQGGDREIAVVGERFLTSISHGFGLKRVEFVRRVSRDRLGWPRISGISISEVRLTTPGSRSFVEAHSAGSNPIDYIADMVYKADTVARQPVAYLGEFEYLVLLAAIRLAPEAYALSILRELETQASRSVTRGALYSTLDRLEDKGLIHWSVATGGADRSNLPRRAYTVTAIGLASVRASHAAMTRMARGLGDLLKDPA